MTPSGPNYPDAFLVADYDWRWRYAVAILERPDLPAVTYRDLDDALRFYGSASESVPGRTLLVLRRVGRFRRRVEVFRP